MFQMGVQSHNPYGIFISAYILYYGPAREVAFANLFQSYIPQKRVILNSAILNNKNKIIYIKQIDWICLFSNESF